jgi:hypothetical protein
MVQLCALAFFVMFVPANFFSLAVISKYGFKISVMLISIYKVC